MGLLREGTSGAARVLRVNGLELAPTRAGVLVAWTPLLAKAAAVTPEHLLFGVVEDAPPADRRD